MDIHDIALKLFAHLVEARASTVLDEQARIELGREAYHYAEAFITAKDLYIRELPVGGSDTF